MISQAFSLILETPVGKQHTALPSNANRAIKPDSPPSTARAATLALFARGTHRSTRPPWKALGQPEERTGYTTTVTLREPRLRRPSGNTSKSSTTNSAATHDWATKPLLCLHNSTPKNNRPSENRVSIIDRRPHLEWLNDKLAFVAPGLCHAGSLSLWTHTGTLLRSMTRRRTKLVWTPVTPGMRVMRWRSSSW